MTEPLSPTDSVPETLQLVGSVRPTYATLEEACTTEYPRLVRLLTLYCGSRDTALDLAQEAMARCCTHWSRVRHMHDQRAWLTRVALNLANSRWRRLARDRSLAARLTAGTAAQAMSPDLDTAMIVRAALADLSPRQRAAVVLRYFDDLDVATTAEVLRCSRPTAKKLTARGLTALRGRLAIADQPEVDR